jgi:HEPN domain-containing protein
MSREQGKPVEERRRMSVEELAAACFHSQQAAEKALKAVLYSQGARVVLGHSVRQLAQQCEVHERKFPR